MNLDLPSDKGIGWYPAGMARLLESSSIFTVWIIEHQRPIELRLPTIALPNDVILALGSRAIALIALLKDAIVSKPNGIGKDLSTIPVNGQSPIRFADNNCRRVMCTRPFNGLLCCSTPSVNATLIGIMA
jgi:hypothetical protein